MLIETLRNILRDVRLATRALAQRRAFAITVLVTLAVGIGAPTAVFSVLHAVLLNPLPYAEPERIVRFRIESRSPRGTMSFDAMPATTALEWQRSSETLSSVALFNERALTLTTAQGPYRLNGAAVTPNLFELLRVPPLLGRAFDPSDADRQQILLGYETWRQHFSARTDVVGSVATFDGTDYRIAGVMPSDFAFPTSDSAFWVPLLIEQGGGRGMLLPAIARLAPQATVAAVVEEGRRLLADSGDGREEMMLHARTLHETLVGTSRRVLWTLMAVVCVVSMIATANIALLLLVRGAARTREFSVRLAIGATRRHLAWQLFVEGVSLAVLGGAAGVALAIVLLGALVQLAPADIPRLREATINGSALLFAAGLTCATSLLFAVLSAGRTLAIDPVRALAGSGDEPRLIASGSPRRRLNLLTAGEIALTVVLLVAAGALIRSFVSLVLIDHGFDSRGALALQVNLPSSRYPSPQARAAFHERLLARLKQFPDIASVGLAVSMPNRQPSGRFDYHPDALPSSPDPLSMTVAEVRSVSEGFMEAMGLRLLAGRTFRSDDRPGAEPVMVISRKLARLHFSDQDPIGRMLYSLTGSRRVVGVVDDVRPLSGAEPQLSAYLPLPQSADMLQWFGTMNVVVRADNAAALTTSLRSLVLSMDPEMPPFNIRALDDDLSRLVAGPRFSASVVSTFAGVALLLAAVGVYGVMAYATGLRTREIGVRVAMGATRRHILWVVLREGVVVVLAGLAAGVMAAVWLMRSVAGVVPDVPASDPLALMLVTIVVAATGLAAACLPAYRATRVSAMDALRRE